MSQGSITSRYGKLEFAQVFTYRFANKLLNNKEVKQNYNNMVRGGEELKIELGPFQKHRPPLDSQLEICGLTHN